MRHVSLYRKWRPRTFDAVAGQEPVVRTLRRAIETGRVAHAYLFSGPRGTGKTSMAKVLAMGLNCVEGPTPEPDGTCESCQGIVNNSSMDVLEMDAASNRGIDEIRDLRDKVNLAPAQGRMKVYIIDEVHMLTTEAFNALLKMLEEPPEHVVFVLATTEKHKVLPTIISRCQSFDFRRPGVALLSEKLRDIAEAEGIEVEPEALTIMAREGRGSFRDSEGLLDQLSSFADGPITVSGVRELLGGAGSEVLLETTDALYERRAAEALRVVDRLQNEGKDLSRFVGELVAHLRRLMLLPHAPEVALAEVGAEERGALEEQANRIPAAEVVRAIEALGDVLSRVKRGGDPKMELELTFLKLARDYTEPSVDNLITRLEALERVVAEGTAIFPNRASVAPQSPEPEEEASAGAARIAEPDVVGQQRRGNEETVGGAPAGKVSAREDAGGDDGASWSDLDWGRIMQDLRDRKQVLTATVFQEGRPSRFDGGVLEISFPREPDFYLEQASNPRHGEALGQVLEERFGARPRLEFRVAGEDGTAAEAPESGANGVPASPQSLRDVPEATPEPVPEPEAERREDATAEVESAGGGSDKIQTQQEVFEMAREWLGPSGKRG